MIDPHLPDPMIRVDEDGTPRSARSDDVYFSRDGGIAETRHVFLDGIDAPECWRERRNFRIGELGFGTGLNFLVTWHDWANAAPADATLDYVAIEGCPIDKKTLTEILKPLSDLENEVAALLDAWPPLVGGVHRLMIAGGRIRLTLMFGDVSEMLSAMQGHVDAWYLDGFAPAKNPDMWTPDVLGRVAELCAPGARIATFTAAGSVRRSLSDLGFEVEKRAGFGRKRDCVAAGKSGEISNAPFMRIAVIGAGIAGVSVARSLRARGSDITLIDAASEPGNGASGNPIALLAPRLPREQTSLGRIMASAYLFALSFYDELQRDGADVWLGERGALTLARNEDEAERQQRALSAFGWPDDVMRRVDIEEANSLVGDDVAMGGLWFKDAGTLSPPAITKHLTHDMKYQQAKVRAVISGNESWRVVDDRDAEIGIYDAVVLTAGIGLADLMADQNWPLRENRGQLSYLAARVSGPRVPVTFGGYVSPSVDLGDGLNGHVMGATYARQGEVSCDAWDTLRDEDTQDMLEGLLRHLPGMSGADVVGGRVSHRATIQDYTPLAGRVNDDLYVLGGLGSRGFLTAPLLAELIADQIFDAPLPLENDLVAALDPHRFKKQS